MPMRVFGVVAKISSKFLHEVAPVVIASVIGTILINHFSRQPSSPSIVVQPPPPAAAEALFQTLRDEHELIVRDADANRAVDAARDLAPSVAPAVEVRANKIEPVSAKKAALRPIPKPASEKKIAARDPEPRAPDPAFVAPPARGEPSAATAARSAGVVERVRDWIVNVSQAPAQALAPRLLDDPPTPPLPVPVSGLQLTHGD
jgi:hypothetical protein